MECINFAHIRQQVSSNTFCKQMHLHIGMAFEPSNNGQCQHDIAYRTQTYDQYLQNSSFKRQLLIRKIHFFYTKLIRWFGTQASLLAI